MLAISFKNQIKHITKMSLSNDLPKVFSQKVLLSDHADLHDLTSSFLEEDFR